jgi:hypothetical protein
VAADVIDTTFDFRSDTPPGEDPDACSPTLRRYHQLLWSKPLPSGVPFELDVTTPFAYLHHRSELGEFFLTSDAVIPTFTRWRTLKHITEQIPEVENEAFRTLGYTIGGMMVFPGNQVDRRPTINGARGFHPQIRDRFDLTLECIRRHYLAEPNNPLTDTLARYADFFGLFGDFTGYVKFFHLASTCCRQPSMRTSGTADERWSSSRRATGGSPLTCSWSRRSTRPRRHGR